MTDLRPTIPADQLPPDQNHRIVLFGAAGTGKTSQILTLPRPIFVYEFEASAEATLRGAKDVHICSFLPKKPSDAGSVFAQSIRKDKRKENDFLAFRQDGVAISNEDYGRIFFEFAQDFWERLAQDWWAKEGYATLALDGLTTLSSHILSRVGSLQEKVRADDRRTDYREAGMTTRQVYGYLAKQAPNLFIALHTGSTYDERTQSRIKRMDLPGSARDHLPTISTICWRTCFARDKGQTPPVTRYCAQTFPDREYDWLRPGPWQVPDLIDLTIEDWSCPEEFGIGRLIKNAPERKKLLPPKQKPD